MTESQVRQIVREQIFSRLQKKLEVFRESIRAQESQKIPVITEAELRQIARKKIKQKLIGEKVDLDLE